MKNSNHLNYFFFLKQMEKKFLSKSQSIWGIFLACSKILVFLRLDVVVVGGWVYSQIPFSDQFKIFDFPLPIVNTRPDPS